MASEKFTRRRAAAHRVGMRRRGVRVAIDDMRVSRRAAGRRAREQAVSALNIPILERRILAPP